MLHKIKKSKSCGQDKIGFSPSVVSVQLNIAQKVGKIKCKIALTWDRCHFFSLSLLVS